MTLDEAMEVLTLIRDNHDAEEYEYQTCNIALGCMMYYKNTIKLPDCNTCQKKITGCEYLPRYGEYVRINCPHYQPEQHLSSAAEYADQPILAPA